MNLPARFPAAATLIVAVLVFSFGLAPQTFGAPGDLDTTFQPGDGTFFGNVETVAVQPDGKLIVAGRFTDAGGHAAIDHVARLNADGTLDTSFASSVGTINDNVWAAAVQPDGKVIIAGDFIDAGGNAGIDGVARLNADGTLDTAFAPGDGAFNETVRGAVLQPGKVIVTGRFTDAGGYATIDNVALLKADGTIDSTFTPGDGTFNDIVFPAVLQPDGKIIVAGRFTDAGGNAAIDYVARLNANGTLDATFAPGDGAINDVVLAAALQPDGKVIVAGDFIDAGGNADIDRVARLNANGTLDTTFAPGDGAINDIVFAATLQTDGKLIVAGQFTDAGGDTSIDRFARLNSNGSVDTTFAPGDGTFVHTVSAATLQADGKTIASGNFTNAGGITGLDKIARLQNGDATGSVTIPDLTQIQWQRGGTAPEASFVSFEYSTTGGAPWTFLGLGTRVSGGWELTGVSIPEYSTIRALAFVPSGIYNASTGIVEVLASTVTDTWSLWYDYANSTYAYYAAYGYFDYALAYYYYYRGFGDYYYYTAYGNAPLADFQYYAGLAYYSYYAYSSLGGTTATYYFYLYFAYAYYYYFLGLGDSGSASYYFNYYYAAALAL